MDQTAIARLWRPAAQRKVRCAFSSIANARADWKKAASRGLAAATELVNAYITEGFLGGMDIGVLASMKGVKESAKLKLKKQQENQVVTITAASEELVDALLRMEEAADSIRTYLVAPLGSPIVRVANAEEQAQAEVAGDTGLGGGGPVYACLSLKTLESLAKEMVEFYKKELHVKLLLAAEVCALVYGEPEMVGSDELDSKAQPSGKRIGKGIPQETLQVYLTAWLGEALLNNTRLDEIIRIVFEEMQAA